MPSHLNRVFNCPNPIFVSMPSRRAAALDSFAALRKHGNKQDGMQLYSTRNPIWHNYPEQSNQSRREGTFELANPCTDVSRSRLNFAVCSRWVVCLRHAACLPTSDANSKDNCPTSSDCFVPTGRSPKSSHCDPTNHYPRI